MRLPLHVSVHIYDHLQGAREQFFVQLVRWIPLMYVRCVFVQYAAVTADTLTQEIFNEFMQL